MERVERIRDFIQAYLQQAITPLTCLLTRLQISPNQVTITGFLITLASAGLLLSDFPISAGIVFLVGSALDLVDGTLARLEQRATPFGTFLDSTLDRIGEGAMFMAIAYRFALQGEELVVAGVVLAMLGGMLTSYTRARAEALGISCKVGWVSRPERVVMIGIGLLFGILKGVIYLLAVLTLWTAGQRVVHVYRSLRTRE